jgi:CRP/FNR family transcriptional regulator
MSYKKGENIFRPGEYFNHVCFIKDGYIRLYSSVEDGKEITFNTFKPVFLLSYYYAKFQKENRFYFQSVTEAEVFFAPKEEFFKYLDENPEIKESVSDMYMSKIEELLIDIENISAGNAYQRIANVIFSLTCKYGKEIDGKLILDLDLTQEVIAGLTGISRETASIQLGKLEKDGYLSRGDEGLSINKSKFKNCLGEDKSK